MRVPHPIPYQGSKRNIAQDILAFFPDDVNKLIEPFAGSAAVSLAVAFHRKANGFVLNDINTPLMKLWETIINEPKAVASRYKTLWNEQQGQEKEYYNIIREKFNKSHSPDYLLYLLARCVKASVRYNSNGKFNQSPDNRRKGTNPNTMREHIVGASQLFHGKTKITHGDHLIVLQGITTNDIVYMDPPYQGVCEDRDPRYIKGLYFDNFIDTLYFLNKKNISYIVSYDGRTGSKSYGKPMPKNLELTHVEIDAGRSSQATLLGRINKTYESIYISPALIHRINKQKHRKPTKIEQLSFAQCF